MTENTTAANGQVSPAPRTEPSQTQAPASAPNPAPASPSPSAPAPHVNSAQSGHTLDITRLNDYVIDEIVVMVEHTLDIGVAIPDNLAQNLKAIQDQIAQNQTPSFDLLNGAHSALSTLILPALPGSLLFLKHQREETLFGAKNFAQFLGPIPIIRHMVIASFIALAAFIYLSVSNQINADEMSKSLFERSGTAQITVSLFLLSSAAIGASFTNLYKAYQYVSKGTFDPNNSTTYWINFALGLIAGYVLAELISLDMGVTSSTESVAASRPLLSLLGGFSASAVYKILNKLVETVGSTVEGDAAAQVEASQASIRARASEQNLQLKSQLANSVIAAKSKLVAAGVPAEKLDAEFEALMKQTLSSS